MLNDVMYVQYLYVEYVRQKTKTESIYIVFFVDSWKHLIEIQIKK